MKVLRLSSIGESAPMVIESDTWMLWKQLINFCMASGITWEVLGGNAGVKEGKGS